ncbi:DUF3261 domain-containing protein [Aidingimonas lacisalsi]|uniref:DUF3261 domain-containing protein n=1 Tax=Aidingimonas lacisalsi TaxID=2604086 RepID=UPI0011D1D2EC|nr:DUF3261 domain-containing protein [Aidingimonas lacisalsi]
MRLIRLVLYRIMPALIVLTGLSGCSSSPTISPSPDFMAAPVTADAITRRLTFTPYDDVKASRTLIGVIRLDDAQLRAALLTPQGQRLVTLVHDSDISRYEPGDVPRDALEQALPFPPAWLAARLEWSLWPTDALDAAFKGSPWSIQIEDDTRVIRHRGKTISRITPASTSAARRDAVLLDDRQGRYRLHIEPLEEASP